MAITYPLNLPTHTGIRSINLRAVQTVGMTMSPFTYKQQTVVHPGQRWEAEITLPAMQRANAEAWVGWLLSLRGRSGTFLLGDPLATSPLGNGGGTPPWMGLGRRMRSHCTEKWQKPLLKCNTCKMSNGEANDMTHE